MVGYYLLDLILLHELEDREHRVRSGRRVVDETETGRGNERGIGRGRGIREMEIEIDHRGEVVERGRRRRIKKENGTRTRTRIRNESGREVSILRILRRAGEGIGMNEIGEERVIGIGIGTEKVIEIGIDQNVRVRTRKRIRMIVTLQLAVRGMTEIETTEGVAVEELRIVTIEIRERGSLVVLDLIRGGTKTMIDGYQLRLLRLGGLGKLKRRRKRTRRKRRRGRGKVID